MNSTKQDTAHTRHQKTASHNGLPMTILSRFLRSFPAPMLAGLASLRHGMLFATIVSRPSTGDHTPPEKASASSADTTSTGTHMPASPSATYLSVQEEGDTLQIAELIANDIAIHTQTVLKKDAATELLSWLQNAAHPRHLKFIAASLRAEDQLKDVASKLWLREDIVPFVISEQDADYRSQLNAMVEVVASYFDKHNIVHTQLGATNEVQVSELVTREDYRSTATPEDFALLSKLAQDFQGKRLVFINATPQGGGVALMRHALIRLMRLFDIDVHWHVLYPKKEVFDITKAKFHNVLQAVAAPDVELNDHDKLLFDEWTQENALAFTDVFKHADVIVIDDPQPSGLIPHIKQINPTAKIIYRSHIQIVASLASQEGTPQRTTWSFIWDKAKEADCFISHPMKMFIPDDVPAHQIYYMPATTDPLDGLNKPLTEEQMDYYMQLFDGMLLDEKQTPLDPTRPYIVQVARFDPSKGIPDLLDSYRKLRSMLEQHNQVIPQLVITGNGSIDDPDGVPMYNLVMEIRNSPEYVSFADDIKVMRLPHIDQLLNTLLRRSAVVLQLSTKEGFEVKVTEALMKGKPMVAYKTGGIPLQIADTINGYLVEVGNTTQVAEHLYNLLLDQELYQRMCHAAAELANKDYLTIPNAICWLYMALKLLKGEKIEGDYQWVKALAEQEYGPSTEA